MAFDFDKDGNFIEPPKAGRSFDFDSDGNYLSGDPKPEPEGGLIASAKNAFGAMVKGAGQAASDFIPGVDNDNAVKRYGQGIIDANPTAVHSLSDIADKPLTAGAEAVGNAAGSVGQMLGVRAVGQGITALSPLTGPAAPAVALLGQAVSWLGPAAVAALPSYGGIRDKQILNDPQNEADWRAKTIATLGAATVGAIESKFGPQQWALSAMTKEGRAAIAEKFAETTLAKGIGFGALKGAAIEGAEELAQNPIEQLAGFDDPRTPENLKETAFGGAMGAIGGGVLGGGFGAAFRSDAKPKVDPVPDILDSPNIDDAINTFVAANQEITPAAIDAGQQFKDLGITAPADDLAMQRVQSEREGAAASQARDQRLQDAGQAWQDLGVTNPSDDLQAQRMGLRESQDVSTNPDLQQLPTGSTGRGGAEPGIGLEAALGRDATTERTVGGWLPGAVSTGEPVSPANRVDANAVEPAKTWFGRKGDGYVTEGDAVMALPSRQKIEPDLSWQVEQMPSGKFRLAGYADAGVKSGDGQQTQSSNLPPAIRDAVYPAEGGIDAIRSGASDRGGARLDIEPGAREAGSDAATSGKQGDRVFEGKQPSAPSFDFTRNDSGTVLVHGDPAAIRAAGINGVAQFKDGKPAGILVGVKSAPDVIAQLEAARVQNNPTNPSNIEAAPVEARAETPAMDGRAPGQAADSVAGSGAVQAVAAKPSTVGGVQASWVIREKATGKTIMETFDRAKVDALNTAKYEAVPIAEHLASLSQPQGTPNAQASQAIEAKPSAPTQAAEVIDTATPGEENANDGNARPNTIAAGVRAAVGGRREEVFGNVGRTSANGSSSTQLSADTQDDDGGPRAASGILPTVVSGSGDNGPVNRPTTDPRLIPVSQRAPKPIDPRLIPKSTRAIDPEHLGADNTPLFQGGKPFKTRIEATAARKNQPMMRVIKSGKGFALAPKTEKQLAAQAAAAKRLATPRAGKKGVPIAAHEVIATSGGLAPELRAELGIEGNIKIGNRYLFAGDSKGLTLERATELLTQDGFLKEGASHTEVIALIKRSLTNPQYTPEGFERMAEAEASTRFEDHLAAQQESAQNDDPFALDESDLADVAGYSDADESIRAEVNALMEQAEAEGIDTDTIREEAHEDTKNGTDRDYLEAQRARAKSAIAGRAGSGIAQADQRQDSEQGRQDAERAGGDDSGEDAGAQSSEGLTAPTREDVLAQQADLEAEKKRREDGGDKPIAAKPFTADQVDLFNPQASIFDAPADPIATAVQAMADAVKGLQTALAPKNDAGNRGTNEAMTNNDVVGNQGGRSADDNSPGAAKQSFREWFKGSKVVDDAGKPLTLYHGTPYEFDEFEISTNGTRGDRELGIWLTDEKNYAEWLNQKRLGNKPGDPKGRVLSLAVRMENPKTIDIIEEGERVADEAGIDAPNDAMEAQEILAGGMGWDLVVTQYAEEARAEGHDGLILKSFDDNYWGGLTTAYIAFKPSQLRPMSNESTAPDSGGANIAQKAAQDSAQPAAMPEDDAGNVAMFSRMAEGITRREALIAAIAAATDAKASTTLGKAKPISAAVLSQQMSPMVAKILRGNGATNPDGAKAVKNALMHIAVSGPVELRAFVQQISGLLPKDGFMLTVDDEGLWNAHGVVSFKPIPHLQLLTAEGRTGLTYETFLHELLHVIVAAKYKTLGSTLPSNYAKLKRGTPQAMAQIEQFNNLWREFGEMAKERLDGITDKDMKTSLREAISSPDEFFVRSLTEPRLQAFLAGIEYKGKTLLQRFKDWVKTSLFGFKEEGTAPSWLDAALLASGEVLEASGRDASDFSTLGAMNAFMGSKGQNQAMFSFAGRQAATADTRSMATAEQRLNNGDNAETVRSETGWSKGVDGKWRFEISDAHAKLNDAAWNKLFTNTFTKNNKDASFSLGHLLDHPKLFTAYPALRSMRVFMNDGAGATYHDDGDGTRFITVGAKAGDRESILLHEIQHGIQFIEGFATGGSAKAFAKELPNGDFDNGFESYRKLAGEVEARNTEARRPLTDEERRLVPPYSTQDVPDRDVIVTYKGKEMHSRSVITGQTLPQTWQAPDATKLDDFIYSMQDKHVDTKRITQAVRAAIGNIADNINPYLQEELYHGRAAMATKEFLEQQVRPLLTDLQARGIDMSDFEEYLHNRHAERRNVQVAKVNPNMPDGGSGINTADARAYLAGLPAAKNRAYQALAAKVDQINRDTRALLVSSGLEKQETIDAWQAAYGDEYVPLMREEMDNGMGIGQGFSVRGGSSKRAMGSNKPVANIIANIALQREKAITRSEKQRIGHALYGMVLSAPNDDFWLAIDPKLQQNPAQILATATQLVSIGMNPADADSIAREPTTRYINPQTGLVDERINPALRSADNALAVRIDGEDKYVFFNAKDERAMRMAKALKNLDADQLGSVMGTVAKMTRYFSAINTQYNPIFGVTNITRDVQTAMLNLESTALKGHKADVMKHILPALRGIYIDLRDHRAGKQPTSAYAAIFEEFQREGGATGYRDMYANAQERADAIKDELADINAGKLKQLGKGVMGWLSDYNESMENAVRVSAYKVGIEQGLTKQQAASLAKNLTVNFNRKGQVALQAGALYAFFNASVQGTARIAETLFEGGKLSAVGKKIITGGLLLGSMQALLLAAAGFDDEEPPDFVRERNLVIPIGDKKYATIPMPLGFHVLPNIARIPTEWVMGGFRNTPKRIGQMVGLFADAFNPIGSAGLSLQTLTPTIIDPLAALSENKDFTGRPIAKKDFDPMHPTAGHTRAKDSATPWAKFISQAVNFATGGTDYKPGLASPTPDQIDYLIGQVFGGVGREVGKATQVIGGNVSGEDVPLHKIPLVGRFVGTTEGQSAEASRFYNNLRSIGEHKVELDGLRHDRKGAEAAEYFRENREAMLVPMATKIQSDVSKLNKLKRELIAKDASPERIKIIDMQITQKMALLNQRVKQMRSAEAIN